MEIVLVYLRDVLINGLASSGIVPVWLRRRWYRLLGMDLSPTSGIYPGCRIGGRTLTMGDDSWLYYDCHVDTSAPVTLGRNVSVSTGVTLVTASHEIGPSRDRLGPDKAAPIVIEDGCWIGIGVTVLGGVTIRKGCVIAAGAFVTRSTKPDGLYAGYPAKRLKDLDPDRPARVGPKHATWRRTTLDSSTEEPVAAMSGAGPDLTAAPRGAGTAPAASSRARPGSPRVSGRAWLPSQRRPPTR